MYEIYPVNIKAESEKANFVALQVDKTTDYHVDLSLCAASDYSQIILSVNEKCTGSQYCANRRATTFKFKEETRCSNIL